MFEIKDLDIYVYPRYLIKNLSFVVNKGDKLAIIGEEGNGKSTLLKAILGRCDYATVTGNINFHGNTVGYLEQIENKEDLEKKIFSFLFQDETEYYSKITIFYHYLEVFKLNDSILNQTMNTLSGGEKVKIRLLKLLLNEPDILFLDEPTNDLDIETLEWLENFINQTNKPIIYVSHDETLLANTANMILHLEQIKKKTEPRHTVLKIDYDTYVESRLRKLEHQTQVAKSEKREYKKKEEKLERIMQKVEKEQNTISRKDPHGAKVLKKKMHTLKSQEKKLENTSLTEIPDVEEQIFFSFENVFIPNTKRILNLYLPTLKIGEKILSHSIKLDVIGPEHICMIGRNGVGKTTLLKMIYQELKDRNDIKVGYMPQNYEDLLGNYQKVLDFLVPDKEEANIQKARMFLGNMKFTKEEMTNDISSLSNGTKAKLIIMKFVLDEKNVLILDEPTRNVSPLSNPVIRKTLKEFKGTIISVSHDRKYIKEVANKVYLLTEDGLQEKYNK